MPKTEVYRNLHKNCFSVRQNGRVVEYINDENDIAELHNVTFAVQPAGRAKVLKEKKKNVHAFVRGNLHMTIRHDRRSDLDGWDQFYVWAREVKYNPYKMDSFYYVDTEEPVKYADKVLIYYGKVFIVS